MASLDTEVNKLVSREPRRTAVARQSEPQPLLCPCYRLSRTPQSEAIVTKVLATA